MSRETLKSFLSNIIGVDKDKISYTTKDTPKGVDLGVEPNLRNSNLSTTQSELLDLDNDSSGLLGYYLNYITENSDSLFGGTKVAYPINFGAKEAGGMNRGDSLPLPETQGAESVFVSTENETLNDFFSLSNSGKFILNRIIDKTGGSGHNNELLSKIEGSDLSETGKTLVDNLSESDRQNPIIKGVHRALKQERSNRFANLHNDPVKTGFATQDDGNLDGDTFDSGFKSVKPFGNVEGTISVKNSYGSSEQIASAKLDDLKNIAASILLKASGFDGGTGPADSKDINDFISDANNVEGSGIKDMQSQFVDDGFNRTTYSNLEARKAKGFPIDPKTKESSKGPSSGKFISEDPESESGKTYGQWFNTEVHFTDAGQKVLRLQAQLACFTLRKLLSEFMTTITTYLTEKDIGDLSEATSIEENELSVKSRYEGPGPHKYGSYKALPSSQLDIFFKTVLIYTDYPYADCFTKGVEIFFGPDQKPFENNIPHEQTRYFLSIASYMIKSQDKIAGLFSKETFDSADSDLPGQTQFGLLYDIVRSNKLVQFANAAATVGDIFFKSTNGSRSRIDAPNVFDVDSLPTTPATRVSKSRDGSAESPLALAWRQESVPSMYILPNNILKAAADLDNLVIGTNPAKGMVGTNLVKNTYISKNMKKSYNRIPNDVAKRLEDRLEGEYVPFYIQDLRTNEIISFHAFLTQLSDTITPNYNSVSGYGRLDPVQIYNNTTRTLNVGFTLYATSKEDFNNMWYKINKFVTLLYPQWTKGTLVSATGVDSFVQPFSQVIGASPIVRLRVGDVIKSNYSKFNLGRIFGIGDNDVNAVVVGENLEKATAQAKAAKQGTRQAYGEFLLDAFFALMGTPLQYTQSKMGSAREANLLNSTISNAMSRFLINGFVNPIGAGLTLRSLSDPNKPGNQAFLDAAPQNLVAMARDAGTFLVNGAVDNNLLGYHTPQRVLLKHNMSRGYVQTSTNKKFFIDRPIKVMVVSRPKIGHGLDGEDIRRRSFSQRRTVYDVLVLDPSAPADMYMKTLRVDHADLLPDPSDIFMFGTGGLLAATNPLGSVFDIIISVLQDYTASAGLGSEVIDLIRGLYATETSKFMYAENNPFVRAFNSTAGRGLAGVLGGITFNWLENNIPWDTDFNSRAPIGCEISFNFNVIHDIPPGIDHSGYNRAPLYNVGDAMKHIAGDPHDDEHAAEFEYKNAGLGSVRRTGTKSSRFKPKG